MRALGRLLRLSLMPSALADVAAGAVLARGGIDPARRELWLALGASACVYHGGMALNDWADRRADAGVRPDRPIPSGAIRAGAALAIAVVLLVLSVALAFAIDRNVGVLVLVLAALAAAYDLAGRGPWIGPAMLGACRALNLLVGLQIGIVYGLGADSSGVVPHAQLFALPALYFAYVFCVSRVGRLEDAPEAEVAASRAPRGWILAALACLALVPFAPRARVTVFEQLDRPFEPVHAWRALGIALAAALVAWAIAAPLRAALATRAWSRGALLACMGMLLRRLLVFTAAAALAGGTSGGAIVAALILCGYPIAYALRRVFPPS